MPDTYLGIKQMLLPSSLLYLHKFYRHFHMLNGLLLSFFPAFQILGFLFSVIFLVCIRYGKQNILHIDVWQILVDSGLESWLYHLPNQWYLHVNSSTVKLIPLSL